ncbi:MAG TPA: ATP-binding cassette domain-containing protein [Mycobacteriales bacterium]|nr:ATP-binding cassette domain-containing protein [Mycobacteriales bacterium]
MSALDLAEVLWLLLAALGLNLAVGFGGQPMLGQGAFVAIGAYGTVLLTDRADLPLGVSASLTVTGAGVAGWLVAFGSSRLRGAYLGLATWGLAWLVYAALTAFPATFGGSQGLVRPAPARLVSRFLGIEVTLTPQVHAVVAAVLCAAVVLVTRSIARGPVGLDLAALRSGPAAAESLGIPGAALRRSTLAASAALGALSGAGTAVLLGLVAPGDVSPLLSVELLVAVLIGGTASVIGPVIGVAVLIALPALADALSGAAGVDVERSRGVVTAALLLAVVALRPRLTRRDQAAASSPAPPEAAAEVPERRPIGDVVLAATGLRHSYGGVRVLDGIDLDVRAGEVHALVGPNGSGKTTTLRLLAGAITVQGGHVRVDGADVTGLDQRGRVLAGVGRTNQSTALFPGLTVVDHLRAGARSTERAGVAWRAVLRTPSWRSASARSGDRVTRTAVHAGLSDRLAVTPERLTHGEQRLLQVARAASTEPRVLLLDEPAAGMSLAESDRLASYVRTLAGNGVAVLLVEHDMRFVAQVADRMTVLAGGRVVATGRPDDVRRQPVVHEVYFGGVAPGGAR